MYYTFYISEHEHNDKHSQVGQQYMQGECLDHWSISLSVSGQLSVRPLLLQQQDEQGTVFDVQQWLRIE